MLGQCCWIDKTADGVEGSQREVGITLSYAVPIPLSPGAPGRDCSSIGGMPCLTEYAAAVPTAWPIVAQVRIT